MRCAADVASPEGQAALFAACPEPDILVLNNAGPPFKDFRELDRQQMLDGVTANMVVPIELIQKAIDPMVEKQLRPHRQHHLRLGEDADRGPRPVVGRARRPHRVPRGRGAHGGCLQCHHQFPAARSLRHRPAALQQPEHRHQARNPVGAGRAGADGDASRPGVSASRTSSAPPAPSCARPMPASSPARIFLSTAASSPAPSDAGFSGQVGPAGRKCALPERRPRRMMPRILTDRLKTQGGP